MAAETTVSISADLTALRRELATLPNLSSEAAQKTFIQIEKAVNKAEAAAKRSAKAVARANKRAGDTGSKAMKGLGEAAGDSDSALKALAGALGVVNPELDAALTKAGDLIGGIEGVTRGTALMGSSFGAMLALLGPFVVVVGAAAAGLYSLKAASDKSKAATEANAKIVEQLKPLTEGLDQARRDLAVATGTLTEAEAKLAEGREGLHEQFLKSTEELRATLNERQADLRALEDALTRVDAAQNSVLGGPGIDPSKAKAKQADELRAEVARLQAQLDAAMQSTEDLRVTTERTAEATRKAKEEDDKATAAKDRLTAAADRAAAALTKELAELEAFLDIAGAIVGQTAELARERKGLNDEVEDSPPDLIPAQWIKDMRELGDQVDSLVPPSALSEIDQLWLLLAQVEGAAKGAAAGNMEFEDMARRLTDQIGALNAEALETAEAMDPDKTSRFWEAFSAGAVAAQAAAAGVAGAVSGAVGMFDRFLSVAAGFSLADLATVAAEGGDVGEIVGEMVKAGTEAVRVFVGSLPIVIDAFLAGLPAIIDGFIDAIGPVVAAVVAAIPQVLDQVVGALPALVDSVVALLPGLFDGIIEKLPMVIGGILDLLPEVITAVLSAVGDVAEAVIAQIPGVTLAVIEALPEIITAISAAIPDLALTLAVAIVSEIIPQIPEITRALTEALLFELPVQMAEAFVDAVSSFFADLLAELQPGQQQTETFGDTPGAVVAPLAGLKARFAPGDTVIAAQDPAEALRQAEEAAGRSSGSQAQGVTLDIRDGHIGFDRMFRRNITGGGSLSTLNSAPVGRVKVY